MIRNTTTLHLLAAAIHLQSCSEDPTTIDWYPASKNECDQWCAFDDDPDLTRCASKPEVQIYLIAVAQMSGYALADLFRQHPSGVCFCAQITLKQDGYFSYVDNVRSNGENLDDAISEILKDVDFGPVPIEASCLLHPPFNPLLFSLDSFQE